MTENKPRNPLTTLWNILSVACGIIGLSSMVQNGFNDLLKWEAFIGDIIEAYRSITVPVFEFLFGWLPFSVTAFIGDYLVMGTIVSASFHRAIGYEGQRIGASVPENLAIVFMIAITWNLIAVLVLLRLLEAVFQPFLIRIFDWQMDAFKIDDRVAKLAAYWFGAIALGVAVLLAINSQR